jgi:MFS family permease
VAIPAALAIGPQRPAGGGQRPGWRSVLEGVRFVRGRQAIQGSFLIDIGANVFGLPRALFPALAATVFGGGATTLGLLYAAPGAGALAGALTTGWVGHVRRQGRAVTVAVIVWGLAIIGFGLTPILPAALALLAVAGWADVISAVFRSAILQLSAPDALRGRLTGLHICVVTSGPRLGDLEAGAVAAAFGDTISVVSGGLACVASALLLVGLLPGFRRQHSEAPPPHSDLSTGCTQSRRTRGNGGGRSPHRGSGGSQGMQRNDPGPATEAQEAGEARIGGLGVAPQGDRTQRPRCRQAQGSPRVEWS